MHGLVFLQEMGICSNNPAEDNRTNQQGSRQQQSMGRQQALFNSGPDSQGPQWAHVNNNERRCQQRRMEASSAWHSSQGQALAGTSGLVLPAAATCRRRRALPVCIRQQRSNSDVGAFEHMASHQKLPAAYSRTVVHKQ